MTSNIVGLEFMDGSVWYCPWQTLTTASGSYFAARFGGRLPPGAEHVDEHGRNVYFIFRDGQLFGNYILPYLATGQPGKLVPFAEDPILWRLLRQEADYYGLDNLSNMLHVTTTIVPNSMVNQGVFYWLGKNKGKSEYRNPYSIGAVDVTGWVDMTREEYAAIDEEYDDGQYSWKTLASFPPSRQALVQYRPPVKGVSVGIDMLEARGDCLLLTRKHSNRLNPVVIDLKSIKLKLTSYSLRWDGHSHKMDWNVEGSDDGVEWVVLHQARGEDLSPPTQEEMDELERETAFDDMDDGLNREKIPSETEISEFLLSYAELKHRRLFHIEAESGNVFYQYIRLVACKGSRNHLYGIGLELFGDVHEE